VAAGPLPADLDSLQRHLSIHKAVMGALLDCAAQQALRQNAQGGPVGQALRGAAAAAGKDSSGACMHGTESVECHTNG
jgi:hypothetical protein